MDNRTILAGRSATFLGAVSRLAARAHASQGAYCLPGMSRVAHHSATTPQPENVDQGSRQDDQMGRSGESQRSWCLHRLPRHQLWTRQASGTGNSSYGKKDSIQVRRVAPLEILRVDLESGLKLLGCASIAELD